MMKRPEVRVPPWSAGFIPQELTGSHRDGTSQAHWNFQGSCGLKSALPVARGLLLALALVLPFVWSGAQDLDGWRVTRQAGPRFTAVDVFVDSGSRPLAAWQLHFSVKSGDAKIVGIEGGEHPAFRQPPYYDPKAIQHERVIIAAFNTAAADKLPKGKTRVATVHWQVSGTKEPQYVVKLQIAADDEANTIPCEVTVEPRNRP